MAEKIESAAQYQIQLKRAVKVGPQWLRPGKNNTVSGNTLREIKEDVSEYKKVS